MDNPFGWDLLYSSIRNDIRNDKDLLVVLAHFALVSNGFKCIGVGESKVLNGDETKTESLPEGWTENYSIRYVFQGVLYNFAATDLGDALMINLIRGNERQVSFVQLNTRSVRSRSGSLRDMIPDHKAIIDTIKKQLIEKVIQSKNSKEESTQTPPPPKPPSPQQPPPGHSRYRESYDHVPNYFNPVGRDDLYPLGLPDPLQVGRPMRGGGGMLYQPHGGFDPMRPPTGMPPGAVPPGARFDPFRPPDVDRFQGHGRRRPDNDEFPPPGYDDMFM